LGEGAATRWLIIASGSALLAPDACAGAWTLPAKASQTIATFSRETHEFGQTWRADDYSEYGLGGGWEVNFKVETQTRIGIENDSRTGVRAGLQKSFALGERASFSISGSALSGESVDGPDCEGEGYEARAAIGTSFNLFGREGFVNFEGASKERENTCHRTSFELTTGIEVFPKKLTLMGKAWTEDGSYAHSAKVEATLYYDWDSKLRIGAGWREEISGDFDEKGWVVSVWRKY